MAFRGATCGGPRRGRGRPGRPPRGPAEPGPGRWSAAFDPERPGGGREGLAWALRRGRAASSWLGPALRPILADPGRQDDWAALRDRTPEDLRPALARAVLDVAADPGLPDEAFRWGVEALLLPLAPRPHDPAWAETYLRRTPSGLDLLRRFSRPRVPEARRPGLAQAGPGPGRGLGRAGGPGRLLPGVCPGPDLARPRLARTTIHVPAVPPEERGLMLGQMLSHVGGASLEGLPFVLDACRRVLARGLRARGARGSGRWPSPLARCLATLRLPPGPWLDRLTPILGRLGLAGPGGRGFEPDGLAAEVVAAAAGSRSAASPWPLRQLLLRHDRAWRILAADVRRDLAEVAPDEAPEVLARWDRQLAKERPERFFELFLNACDGPRLAACVVGPGGRPEDAAPPALVGPRPPPRGRRRPPRRLRPDRPARPAARGAAVPGPGLGRGAVEAARRDRRRPARLSARGQARWRCLEALTNFRNAGRRGRGPLADRPGLGGPAPAGLAAARRPPPVRRLARRGARRGRVVPDRPSWRPG